MLAGSFGARDGNSSVLAGSSIMFGDHISQHCIPRGLASYFGDHVDNKENSRSDNLSGSFSAMLLLMIIHPRKYTTGQLVPAQRSLGSLPCHEIMTGTGEDGRIHRESPTITTATMEDMSNYLLWISGL